MIPALGLGLVGLGLLLPTSLSGLVGSEVVPAPPASPPVAVAMTEGRSLAIRGLRAEIRTGEKPDAGGGIAWWTTWLACWDPVPGASDYLVTTVSFEGAGRPMSVAGTCHELAVAGGTTLESGNYPGRTEQLIQMEISMSVSVAARLSDGTVGPSSPDIAVGRAYP